jgi:hypothetical protein
MEGRTSSDADDTIPSAGDDSTRVTEAANAAV